MATELTSRALTSLSRVKSRLTISSADHDTVLERLIMGASDHIQSFCNRTFKRQTYTNEIYSPPARGMDTLALKQTPVVSISAAEYRAGTPSAPSYTAFTTDQFEIVNDGAAGLVRVYGGVPYGTNAIRFTYIAGYLIDFENPASATHTLPFDLSDLCERLVTKLWKRRESEGKTAEALEGSSVSWGELLTKEDREILSRYTRVPSFV